MKNCKNIAAVVGLIVFSVCCLADAEQMTVKGPSTNPADWIRACEAAGYDRATAHEPHFDDKALWPGDVTVTDYYRQSWSDAPVMIWTKTGDAARDADPQDPANWLIDGRPAERLPDESTDIVFPSGKYVVGAYKYKGAGWSARHVTIGSQVICGVSIQPAGNVWIKKDGLTSMMSRFTGDRNTFVRNDNNEFNSRNAKLANKIVFAKTKESSVEVVGTIGSWDELSLLSGTLIVGPGSKVVPGDRSIQCVFPDARLVLMSGSKFHKRSNQTWSTDIIVSGSLWAGTPERPLTTDCMLGLCFKAKGDEKLVPERAKAGSPDDVGLLVRPEGGMRVHTADPNRARLVITWCGLKIKDNEIADLDGLSAEQLRARPEKVDVVLQGDLKLDGVNFDWMRKGGIMMAEPTLLRQWTWSFGRHNAAEPSELIAAVEGATEAKLRVGMGQVELKAWLKEEGMGQVGEHLGK